MFPFPLAYRTALGVTQPPIRWVKEPVSFEGKRLWCSAGHHINAAEIWYG
jgi:hypothetical protein